MPTALRSLLLTGLAVLATAGPSFAAPTPGNAEPGTRTATVSEISNLKSEIPDRAALLQAALNARAAGRTAEAIRLLTELNTLTPGDKRVETLLASLQAPPPPGNAGPRTRPASETPPPQEAAISAREPSKENSLAVFSESPTESSKAKPDSPAALEIKNQESQISNRSALLQAALAAQAAGKPGEALAYLRELQSLSPDDPRLNSIVSTLTPQASSPPGNAGLSTRPASETPLPLGVADSPPPNQDSQNKNQESAYYALPESIVLGVVTWVDPANKQAVVRLYGTWKPDRLYLLSRDASFEASAVLETSPFHNSRAIGVRAIEGMPLVGQEVIAPGPSVLRRIQEILGPRFRGTPPAPVVKTPDPAAPVETAAPTGQGTLNPDLKPF